MDLQVSPCELSRVGRRRREDVMAELTPRFSAAMEGVEHSFAQIAKETGYTPDAVARVMTGRTKDPGERIVESIMKALDRLRGTCPHCGQKLPPKGPRDAVIRRDEKTRRESAKT